MRRRDVASRSDRGLGALLPGALALVATLASSSCVAAPPPAPEGFTLSIQLTGIRASVVDNVRIVLIPQVVGAASPRFSPIEPFDAGGVQVSVDGAGRLVLVVSGDYVRANGIPRGEGDLDPRIDVELWSDDDLGRAGPQILGYAVIGGAQLGMAAAYLPEWPLPLGAGVVFPIACTAGFEAQCAPPP